MSESSHQPGGREWPLALAPYPLANAQAQLLLRHLASLSCGELRLNRGGWIHLEDLGFDREEAHHAIDRLVATGLAELRHDGRIVLTLTPAGQSTAARC